LIQAAGWPIWFLIATSLVAVALIVERFLSLKRDKVLPPKLLDDVLALHRSRQITPELVQRLEASSPIGRVFASGLRQELAPRDVMKEAMEETGRAVAHDLEKYLSALGTIASLAPLMGLFGTVVGMIEIFGSQAPSGGTNPQQLAHGISVALYNTAFGLVIAIPSMICYRHFRARVDGYLVEMEQQSLRLIDTIRLNVSPPHIAAHAVQASAAAAPAPAPAPRATPPSTPAKPRSTASRRAPAAAKGAAR
jgi:biopolymer transport protein ExbB